MNFLAHCYLSGDNSKILVGNFIADFVKGKKALEALEPAIADGVELHRHIDQFTDQHEIVRQSKKLLQDKYRHYSGVIVDVLYDHFLARDWSKFHRESLPVFASKVYATIDSHFDILPEGVRYMLPYMTKGNWLLSYSKLDGIERALAGMSRRTPYDSKMDKAITDIKKDYDAFAEHFNLFFPELQRSCQTWFTNLNF